MNDRHAASIRSPHGSGRRVHSPRGGRMGAVAGWGLVLLAAVLLGFALMLVPGPEAPEGLLLLPDGQLQVPAAVSASDPSPDPVGARVSEAGSSRFPASSCRNWGSTPISAQTSPADPTVRLFRLRTMWADGAGLHP